MSDLSKLYTYVENKDQTWTGIGLTQEAGKYQGVVYRYGEVKIVEDENGENATLQFEWDVLDSNGLPKEMIGEDFFKLIGDILVDIMEKQIEEDSLQYVNTDD
jgi:hypothetical protein